MKRILLLLTTTLAIFSCDSEKPGEITREYFNNSTIEYTSFQGYEDEPEIMTGFIQSGQNITFRYSFFHPQDDNISDDELAEIFILEIPKNSTEFSYSTSSSLINANLKADYRRSCFCGWTQFELVRAEIFARKLSSNQWEVNFEVLYKDRFDEYLIKDAGKYNLGRR